jgi:DNA repair exonuclease SbcCD nuclease subunit
MAREFKFIHAADIHLGSILHVSKKVDKNLKDIFNNAVYYGFDRLCDLALEKQVDFIIISGDIYDREARSIKANSFFVEQCRRLEAQGIKVYAIGGNHDPMKKNSELFTLPENVHIFSSETAETMEFKNQHGEVLARIIGQSYRENWDSRKIYMNYNAPKDDILNIALLHTQLDNNNNYVPCSFSDLKAVENIDYWALGHIHKYNLINSSEPTVVYPGIPQGRDFGEEGMGGVMLVEAADDKIANVQYIPISQVIFKKININLDMIEEQSPNNISDLESIIKSKAEDVISEAEIAERYERIVRGYAVKWTISGRSEVYKLLEEKDEELIDYLLESLNSKLSNRSPFIYSDSIEFNIGRPIGDLELLKAENSVYKEISSFAQLCMDEEDVKQQLIRRLGGLWEMTGDLEDINFKKLQLDEETLHSIIKQAEQLAVDVLLQRSEEE